MISSNLRPFNPFGGPIEGSPFFPRGFWDKIFSDEMPFPAPVKRNDTEKGTVLEFNLAGFTPEEVSVKVDTAFNQLTVAATHAQDTEKRNFETKINLSPYVKASDISTSYNNGLLTVTITNVVKADDTVVEIPVESAPVGKSEVPVSEKIEETKGE